jgi:phosphohistidine phosphatase SixA
MRIFLVRHAHAGSRHDWDGGPDHERPLTPDGWQRANQLIDVLGGQGVARLLSSHFLRCTQTLGPLAAHLGLQVETHPALAEGAPLAAGIDLVESLVADATTAALCSHGDVIPELLAGLARRGVELDPRGRCPKGSVWVLEVEGGAVARARYAGVDRRPIA